MSHKNFYRATKKISYSNNDLFVHNPRRLAQVIKVLKEEYPSDISGFENLMYWGKFDEGYKYLCGFLDNVPDSPVFGYIYYHNVDTFGSDIVNQTIFRGLTHRTPPKEAEMKKADENQKTIDEVDKQITKKAVNKGGYHLGYNKDGRREKALEYTQIVFKDGHASTIKRLRSVKTGRFLKNGKGK